MTIQINTDKNISGNEKLESYLKSLVEDELSRFGEDITRVEVHLSDTNGSKNGQDDKHCTFEVRLKNRQPIAVSSNAKTVEESVNDAIEKAKNSMDKIFGKLKQH